MNSCLSSLCKTLQWTYQSWRCTLVLVALWRLGTRLFGCISCNRWIYEVVNLRPFTTETAEHAVAS